MDREKRGGKRKPAKLRFWDANIGFPAQREECPVYKPRERTNFSTSERYSIIRAGTTWRERRAFGTSWRPQWLPVNQQSHSTLSVRKCFVKKNFSILKLDLIVLYGWLVPSDGAKYLKKYRIRYNCKCIQYKKNNCIPVRYGTVGTNILD